MKRNQHHATLYILSFIVVLVVVSCNNKDDKHDHSSDVYYTCPMHPQVVRDKPGSCPICGMTLVKMEKKRTKSQSHQLSEEHALLANVRIDTAKNRWISEVTTFTGTVVPDETLITTVSSKVKGRIEELYVNNPGDVVSEGQALYQIYSEELLADETDFVELQKQAQKQVNNPMLKRLLESSRTKLAQWGLTSIQIDELAASRSVSPYVTFRSGASGVIAELSVREGEYVSIGTPVVTLIQTSTVWVETQLYASEAHLLFLNPTVDVTFEQLPGEVHVGRVVNYTPQLQPSSKINVVRVSVDNTSGLIKTGMMAYVNISIGGRTALTIPQSAVLREKMSVVWIKDEDGRYIRKMIETGIEGLNGIEVLNGLKEGDLVVSSGAYLLNSEYMLSQNTSSRHSH